MSEHKTIAKTSKIRRAKREVYRRLKAMAAGSPVFRPNAGEPAVHFVNHAARLECGGDRKKGIVGVNLRKVPVHIVGLPRMAVA